MRPQGFDKPIVVVGENLHATRVLLRGGKHVVAGPSGEESIRYTSTSGETRHLAIPEDIKPRQDYQEGRIKHVAVGVRAAMSDQEPAASEGREYLRTLAERQIRTGADYLDLNVDEVSLRHHEQIAAMHWLVHFVEGLSPIPLSIDSSNMDTIRAGIEACQAPLMRAAARELDRTATFQPTSAAPHERSASSGIDDAAHRFRSLEARDAVHSASRSSAGKRAWRTARARGRPRPAPGASRGTEAAVARTPASPRTAVTAARVRGRRRRSTSRPATDADGLRAGCGACG